jgi:hypothetical protein
MLRYSDQSRVVVSRTGYFSSIYAHPKSPRHHAYICPSAATQAVVWVPTVAVNNREDSAVVTPAPDQCMDLSVEWISSIEHKTPPEFPPR